MTTATVEKVEAQDQGDDYLPEAVRRDAETANATLKALQDAKSKPAADTPPADESKADSHEDKAKIVKLPDDQSKKEVKDGDESWQVKYKALQGKYSAEVPRLAEQIRVLKSENAALRQENATLKTAPAPKKPEAWASDKVDEKNIDEFGPEFRALYDDNKKLRTMVSGLVGQIETLQSGVTQATAQDARTKFFATMDKEVQNWRTQNDDNEFVVWLSVTESEEAGVDLKTLLDDAVSKADAVRVSKIFKRFRTETGKTYSGHEEPSKELPKKPSVAPPRSRSAADPLLKPEGKIISRAEIERFYDDVARGKYQGREAEKQAFENEIFNANKAGRIR